MDKEKVIAELRRVAGKLEGTSLTQRQFKEHGQISVGTV
jgi:hypothetical protein